MAWHGMTGRRAQGALSGFLSIESDGHFLFFLLRGSSFSGYFFLRFATAAPVDHAMSISHGYDGEQETEGSGWSIEGCGLGEEEESSAFVGGCVSLVEHPRTDGRTDGGRGQAGLLVDLNASFLFSAASLCLCLVLVMVCYERRGSVCSWRALGLLGV